MGSFAMPTSFGSPAPSFLPSGKGGDNNLFNFSLSPRPQIADENAHMSDMTHQVGSNQYQATPPGVIPASNVPGVVPPSGAPVGNPDRGTYNFGLTDWGSGFKAENPMFPNLSTAFGTFLQNYLGKGATPFNLQALLPSNGQATGAGQLSAPMTQMLQQLQGLFSGQVDPSQAGALGGAFGTLSNVAKNGISAVPTWNTMVDAMQRQIGQGANNLREQFASMGALAGSPFGTAMSDYQNQSSKDLNSILAQMQYQGIQEQLGAASGLLQGGNDLGQFIQGLDQASVDRLYNEFLRTQPEYNPLLGMLAGLSTTFQPVLSKNYGMGAGAALQGIGSIASGIGDLIHPKSSN